VIDDVLAGLFGEAVFGRLGRSRRAQLLARLFFGVLGTGLGLAGALQVVRTIQTSNTELLAAMTALFVFLACFCLFNVALGRTWRWPGLCFVASLVMIFATRIVGGP
jgi:predicted acyltransferase